MDFRKRLLEAGIKDADYIGDGVYVGNDGFQIWLYVADEGGYNRVAIEPVVMEKLIRYNTLFVKAKVEGREIYPHLNKLKEE